MKHQIAKTILNQIPMRLQFALGIRDIFLLADGLRFRATGTRAVWVDVTLNAADLYDVNVYTKRKKKGDWIPTATTRFAAQDVDAAQFIDILDRMDRGAIVV